mmetsp:Transcript_91108/g.181681  ORF Transcript_91108/g.181681 Transcript_91108/m.181681 type:complete len:82 (-) Transcript_91108:151-396(-)
MGSGGGGVTIMKGTYNVNTNRKGRDRCARGYANVTVNFNQICTGDSGGTQNSEWADITHDNKRRGSRPGYSTLGGIDDLHL